jgi:hypothetical protein
MKNINPMDAIILGDQNCAAINKAGIKQISNSRVFI